MPNAEIRRVVEMLDENAKAISGCRMSAGFMRDQGIAHVIASELGFAQPGMLITCNNSHTATNGACGALAVPIGGGNQLRHVVATQTVWLKKPKTHADDDRRQATSGGDREGHNPVDHPRHRGRRRDRLCGGVCRLGDPRHDDGRPADDLQHVDRRLVPASAWLRPTTSTFAVPQGPAQSAEGRRLGQGLGVLVEPCQAMRMRCLIASCRSTPTTVCANGDVGHEPGGLLARRWRRARTRRDIGDADRRRHVERALDYMRLQTRDVARRGYHRSRLYRLLHQQPHRGSCARRRTC